MTRPSQGAVPSPNIWHHPETYEIENHAADPDGVIESAMRATTDWSGRTFLDLGCGTGFHLARWAETAREVIGVEPHPDLVSMARRRVRRLGNTQVRQGTAQEIPLPDASVDVMQARWAYFFGPGCEPGLAELDRVMRRGGTAFVIDNDASRSTFGGWFRRGYPMIDPDAVERFWSQRGWTRQPLDIRWSFANRTDFEAVVRIEFDAATAAHVLSTYDGFEVDYAVNLWIRGF
ncbi:MULTISPECIES: class I SAM-dependent methyltransferase [unclassified Nocardioides]|uniref:class I SAM-dependent methyltransferase n=1 Tax=unclassified Nocardioides TaxID=2615069 RepID=UPI0006FE526E|nr:MULTISPECIES: class I SAM-dependent methyltransferase [unclassified Nocardioides]KQY50196.1 methyltransferase type 11 [Nocardioides sp. Root140]KQZ75821.1 methyltransferase type 11 [Nocardioides sp. Root151]KRF14892.1 methyltransferase type 11 [Nocardioides sp. Soil796]